MSKINYLKILLLCFPLLAGYAGVSLAGEITASTVREARVSDIQEEAPAFDELEAELRRLEAEIGATVEEEESLPTDAGAEDAGEMEFDLSFDEGVERTGGATAAGVKVEGGTDDGGLDFDWGAIEIEKEVGEELSLDLETGETEEPGVDAALAFEATTPPGGEKAQVIHGGAPGAPAEPEDGMFDLSDLGAAGETNLEELTTKLDLARAYVDMDDKESAIDILEEVLRESSGAIREEAEALRKQLG